MGRGGIAAGSESTVPDEARSRTYLVPAVRCLEERTPAAKTVLVRGEENVP